ncbi:MAG: ABC transporter ATP-binding protein [Chitinophagales bacterium]
MSQNIFEIRKLVCSYNHQKPVLKIDHLDIPKGKIIVILGKSGIGKSTLLETLGLMNDTILDKANTVLDFKPIAGETHSFKKIWKTQKNTAEVRKNFFSFIFQDTNLMPNFTVHENILLTQMIQNEEHTKRTIDILDKVGLGEIGKSKKAFELSGGQRQRVAFVRAITPTFTVLFGDEPTGNLDEGNAKDLMDLLKEEIKKNKTAIIVSHNIDLALQYAHNIIVLTEYKNNDSTKESYGELLAENVFKKDENEIWKKKNGTSIEGDIKQFIKQVAEMK